MADIFVVDQIRDEMGSEPWDNEIIIRLLDVHQLTPNEILLRFWTKKSADTSILTNVSESGSSRSLDQIHKHSRDMANMYQQRVASEVAPDDSSPLVTGIRSHPIKRV